MIKNEELFKKFPNLREARVCVKQENFQIAADIYSEILNKAINEEKMSEDDIHVSLVKLEYANSLIRSSIEFFTEEINLLSNHQVVNHSKRIEKEEDLEIAWGVLESVRIVFTEAGDEFREKLSKTYFYLAEILMLNNKFNEAVVELNNCLETLESIYENHDLKLVKCLDQIAICHEFSNEYNEAKKILSKILVIYEKNREHLGDKTNELMQEILTRLVDLENRMLEVEDDVPKETILSSEADKSDIIIDINMRKKKKKVDGKEDQKIL